MKKQAGVAKKGWNLEFECAGAVDVSERMSSWEMKIEMNRSEINKREKGCGACERQPVHRVIDSKIRTPLTGA